ncbi:MAG: AEC family transporter, partial [Rhodospirillaceae bacterium]
MAVLINGVLPIFAVVVVGYVFGFRKIFSPGDAASINKFVFMVAIPALSVDLIVSAPFASFDWRVLFGFFLAEVITYVIGLVIALKLLKCTLAEAILIGLASAFGNHLLFVLPITQNLFGELAALPIVAIIAVDSILLCGGTLMAMEIVGEGQFTLRKFGVKILKNPPIMSLVLGLALAVCSVKLPKSVLLFIDFSGRAGAPCALFSLGIVLSQISLAGRRPVITMICLSKLATLPLLAWVLLMSFLDLDFAAAKIPLMAAVAPCGSMAFVFALNYHVRTDAIAPAIFFSTLISVLTLS